MAVLHRWVPPDRDSGTPPSSARPHPWAVGAPLLVLVLAALLWMGAKVALFDRLAYTSDLFSFVQMSNSFLRGRPLLHENCFGAHRVHNNYLILLLAPLSLPWGAPGIFLGSVGLSFASWAAALLTAARDGAGRLVQQGATVAALSLGPVAFWIWDNPVYGWHAEILYLPLAVLFALSLERGARWSWLWAALIVLNREEGAVLAWSVHLLWILNGDPATPRRWRRAALATAGWLAVFLLGLAWLRLLAGSPPQRLTQALGFLSRLVEDPELRGAAVQEARRWLVLVAAGLLPLAAVRAWRRLGWTVLLALPVFAVTLVGAATYASYAGLFTLHGVLWPPRFVLVWSLVAAGLLLRRPQPDPGKARSAPWGWVLACGVSLAVQYEWLERARGYVLADRVIPSRAAGQLPASRLSPAEKRFLSCLEDRVPVRTPVATDGSLFRYFHGHDLVWPDRAGAAWAPPALVVCDVEKRLMFNSPACEPLQEELRGRGLRELSVGGIAAVAEAPLEGVVSACGSGHDSRHTRGQGETLASPAG